MTSRAFAPILALLIAACAHGAGNPTAKAGTAETVISLRDINCQSCGQAVARMLQARDGVAKVTFDQLTAEVRVTYVEAKTRPEALVSAVREAGYAAELGPGRGAYAPEVTFPEGADVEWISRAGEDVDVEAHRVSGKVTVVDFYAKWCGPCRDVDREMAAILATDPDVALRKVNVMAWDTAVAKRYLSKVESLPYVLVYGRDGKRVAAVAGLDVNALRRAIAAGKAR